MTKEYIENIQNGKCSKMEVTLTGICLFLFGLVIGMKIAPARASIWGSLNGNTGSLGDPEELKKLISKKKK